jgi:hypothetical protein
MNKKTNPTQSKGAAFEAFEQETTAPTTEQIWVESEKHNQNLTETVATEVDQFNNPEDYKSEPIPEYMIQTDRISELLDK